MLDAKMRKLANTAKKIELGEFICNNSTRVLVVSLPFKQAAFDQEHFL